ncbi:hypothetical protein D6C91_00749 [Aureobasidium pullulans]|uniref:Stress-associated endoplasmic reticulum protein n=1 Tax=Aureobasidium pullulans TaxID=5580 RepID=A0A4S9P8B9_AURPU|nr:hypothetical protein D6C97_02087 [Aureobasidium pullulans]THZ31626.1 hypothetical protein D6C91_00749 [Aureobasidium pullulans]
MVYTFPDRPNFRDTRLIRDHQVQTPQQRRANEAFAKKQEVKRGKPEPVIQKKVPQKSPISKFWLFALIFVVCGGLIAELLRIISGYF